MVARRAASELARGPTAGKSAVARSRARARLPGRDLEGSRQRIHAAAIALFARYGYEGVSLQRIADEVGLHKSSLFHHYRGKLELVDEVIDAVLERVLEWVRPLADEDPPRLQSLLRAIDRLVDHFSEEPEAARLIIAAMTASGDSELRRSEATERVVEFFTTVSRWLDRARKAGVIRPLSIRQAIPNLIGIVLFYPAIARDHDPIVGPGPFSLRARQVRKVEVEYVVRGMLEPR